MKALSLFSGIGGFDLGFQRAGMDIVGMCEIDKHAQKVLRKRFPDAELYDDVKKIGASNYAKGTINLISGGFPCQDVSVAGKRAGLDGKRSGLWFEFARIIDEIEPKWVVIENVPGLFSSASGEDFATIIQWLANRGYGVGWRVFDSQYFGLAQRRKRVFIVASFGTTSFAKVLFEQNSISRHHSTSRKKGEKNTSPTDECTDKRSWCWKFRNGGNPTGERGGVQTKPGGLGYLESNECAFTISATQDQYISFSIPKSSNPITTKEGMRHSGDTGTLIPITYSMREDDKANTFSLTEIDKSLALQALQPATTSHHAQMLIVDNTLWEASHGYDPIRVSNNQDIVPTLSAKMGTGGNNVPLVGVRRLTPTECERLQGFPDGWTDGQQDTQRYKQLGNAVSVNVAEWIGKRIMEYDNE
jgi:DNA (cytosine-5)-methyltransferase 1